MHGERTKMMLSKEEYFNQVFELQQMEQQVSNDKQLLYLESFVKKLNQQKSLTK